MLVMVVLIVLTAIMYRVGSSVSQWKHRQQYMIDYQKARYACESGLKYALAMMDKFEPNYVSRPNEPDFSDLFTMSDEEYSEMMETWAREYNMTIDANNLSKTDFGSQLLSLSFLFDTNDTNNTSDANDANMFSDLLAGFAAEDPNGNQEFFVRGPYGPAWPYITEPIEIDFGYSRVRVEIIDENAKLPLTWGISSDEEVKQETKAAVTTFFEWMQMEPNEIKPIFEQLEEIKEIKPFSTELKPVVTVGKEQVSQADEEEKEDDSKSRLRRRRSRRARRSRRSRRARTRTVKQTRPDVGHARDFSKLMYSPMLDVERLARPVNEDEDRKESALKYISLWGTDKVNVNTAPRHVLEAAFTFGGDAVEIADAIINLRREKAFTDAEDLKKRLFSYSNSVDKCQSYITTQSNYFSIRSEATSGVAKVCAIAALKKEGKRFQKIGIITE